jgi:hypothetical protein
VSKLKDGEEGAKYGFRLKTVPLELDEDGDHVSSCVVEQCAAVEARKREKKFRKNVEIVWQAILSLQRPAGDNPTEEQIVAVGAPAMPRGSGPRDRRREAAGKALNTLVEMGKVKRVADTSGCRVAIVS